MPRSDEKDLELKWSGRWMLLHRILAVNVFALAILAGSIFYLDSFRGRLTTGAVANAETQVGIMANSLSLAEPGEETALLRRLGTRSKTRLRVFRADGTVRMDSWDGAPPPTSFATRAGSPGARTSPGCSTMRSTRSSERRRRRRCPSPSPTGSRAGARRRRRARGGPSRTMLRRAPEGTPFISAAKRVPGSDDVLLLTRNARDIRRIVRDERTTLLIVVFVTLIVSVLLSLFLARTIALPLRRLARAAHRVRLGRAREVSVPTLPERRDEIGLLARALGDMTQSLRYADRCHRGLRRRRHPRAQEPARLAAFGGRQPRQDRGSGASPRS